MKRKKLFLAAVILFILGLSGWWFWGTKRPKAEASALKHSSAPIAQDPASNLSPAEIKAIYTPEQIQAGQAINAMLSRDPNATVPMAALVAAGASKEDITKGILDAENAQPIEFYGKVADQYGQPVAGATVYGNILLNSGIEGSATDTHTAETDAKGLFQFTGLHGVSLGVGLKKIGYDFDWHASAGWSKDYKPDPKNPVAFTMYKLQGAEPMVHLSMVSTYVQCDGTPVNFNLLNGQKNGPIKDMEITFVRDPINIEQNKHFDWTLTLTISDGGFSEITGFYPNEAPESGYKSTITIQHTATDKDWSRGFDGSYYFKARNGQVYGRIKFTFGADYQPPPTGMEFEIYANPASSRNLEFDGAKEIKAK